MVREIFCLVCNEDITNLCDQCISNASIVQSHQDMKFYNKLTSLELKKIKRYRIKNRWMWKTDDIENYILNNYDENHKKAIRVKKTREDRECNYLKLIAAREEIKELLNKTFTYTMHPQRLHKYLSQIFPHEEFDCSDDADVGQYDSHDLAIRQYTYILDELNDFFIHSNFNKFFILDHLSQDYSDNEFLVFDCSNEDFDEDDINQTE